MSLILPVGLSARGVFHVLKKDLRTGTVVEEREVPNMLLIDWTNHALQYGYIGILRNKTISNKYYCYCLLGDDGTPPVYTDTGGIKGNRLGYCEGYEVNNTRSNYTDYPAWDRMVYKFPAGVATGTIREISIQAYYNQPTKLYSRVVLDPPITKTDTDELVVTYTRFLYRNADCIQGVIPRGQSDGITDISWISTINNTQLRALLNDATLASLVDNSLKFSVDVGSSNAPTDLAKDGYYAKTRLSYLSPNFIERLPYDLTKNYRDVRFGFDTGYANGDIAEMAIYGIGRLTFNPSLKKTNNRRLYLIVRFTISAL